MTDMAVLRLVTSLLWVGIALAMFALGATSRGAMDAAMMLAGAGAACIALAAALGALGALR